MTAPATSKSTAQALKKLLSCLPSCKPIDGKKLSTLDDVFELDDFALNILMEHFTTTTRKNNGDRYKNGSLMTIVISIQRGINVKRIELWRTGVENGNMDRNKAPKKVLFKNNPIFIFYDSELDVSMKTSKEERGAKVSTIPLKNSMVKNIFDDLSLKIRLIEDDMAKYDQDSKLKIIIHC
jgi:hypothetical protein